ncbi:hypothetical protein X975_13002, partial [Stegodyphus mimosarum]
MYTMNCNSQLHVLCEYIVLHTREINSELLGKIAEQNFHDKRYGIMEDYVKKFVQCIEEAHQIPESLIKTINISNK